MSVAVIVMGALALPTITSAAPGRDAQQSSFAGSCSFTSGTIAFTPGLKLSSDTHSGKLTASGSCASAGQFQLTGTLTGKANCTGGQSPFTGMGTLTVGGTSVQLALNFALTLPSGGFTFKGATSGSASGTANYANGGNVGEMPGCVGNGLQTVSFKGSFATSSALVSTTNTAPTTKPTPKLKVGSVSIRGTAKAGDTLRVATAGWTRGVQFHFQWFAAGRAIKGATRSSLKLTRSDAGKRITVEVIGSHRGYTGASRTSAATGKVKS